MSEHIVCDALDSFRNDVVDTYIDMCCGNDYNKLTLIQMCDAIDCIYDKHIDKHTVADVVEVRHGEWIDYESNETYGCYESKEWYKCSCCGKDAYGRCDEDPWYSHPILSDYCPFCGAKMDGKGEE